MRNAKEELVSRVTKTSANIKCATIRHEKFYYESSHENFTLKEGYSESDMDTFLNSLDFEYNEYKNGHCRQELFGTVWLSDGTWLDRDEYDGSEWWEHHECPEIPQELKQ